MTTIEPKKVAAAPQALPAGGATTAAAPAEGAADPAPRGPRMAADGEAIAADKGPRASIGLGAPAPGPAPAVPNYGATFGAASYVKDGGDAKLVDLARRAAAASPELAGGGFGAAARQGKLGPDDVRALQRHLEAKGFPVGDTGVDGKYGPRTHQALQRFLAAQQAGPSAGPADAVPATGAEPAPGVAPATGPMQGAGMEKDGLRIPAGEGRATTFWNGHMAYKGKYDLNNRQNGGLGAWGDKNAPTDYFVALPVKDKRWHNQKILITNPATGQQVVARVQDKGPGARTGAKIDLSPVTMEALGGHFQGDLKRVKFEFAPEDAAVGPVRREARRA